MMMPEIYLKCCGNATEYGSTLLIYLWVTQYAFIKIDLHTNGMLILRKLHVLASNFSG